jgi:hypothetical protein
MDLRHSAMPGGPEPEPPAGTPLAVSFRVDGRLTAVKVAGTLILLLVSLLSSFQHDPARTVVAALAALVLGCYAVRDVAAPVRLAADADGVTVVGGFTAKQRLSWDEIERVRVDERRRLGTRSQFLEIDAGDSLHLFSSYDLGVPCWEAARALASLTRRLLDTGAEPGQTPTDQDH